MKLKTRLFISSFLFLALVLQTSGWAETCDLCDMEEMSHDAMLQMASCHVDGSTAADVHGAGLKAAGCDCCAVIECADVVSYAQESVGVAEPTAQYSHMVVARFTTGFNIQVFASSTLPGKYKQKTNLSPPFFILHSSLLI